jgi:hypothetical protein
VSMKVRAFWDVPVAPSSLIGVDLMHSLKRRRNPMPQEQVLLLSSSGQHLTPVSSVPPCTPTGKFPASSQWPTGGPKRANF